MNNTLRRTLDIVMFFVTFFLIQYLAYLGVHLVSGWLGGSANEVSNAATAGANGLSGKQLVVSSAIASVLTIAIFLRSKWAPISRNWLSTHPWTVLVWVVFLALGTILPSQWIDDQMQISMPERTIKLFEDIMGIPSGYLALGILAPIAEELVFRGAILRTLLKLFDNRMHWIPIICSALIFGAAHGNLPQFIHATLIGLLIGWMYYRTDSVIPGIVLHWVNNTVAYIMFNLMPHMADGKLIDLFHGSDRMMWLGIGFSLCILIPSLLQLNIRLKQK